ncbi:MAG: 3-oxoacid CoA-transferase subunit A [Chloroflexi bacterium]|nr:3-oxoacid CoA-transferase subunit A [Chloroflexota bacterium]
MRNKVYGSFDEVVSDIPDGSTIMIPGFAGPGTPRNLIAALLRQGAKELTAISNHPGAGPFDHRMDLGRLVEAGRVRKVVCSFTASPHPSQATAFEKLYNDGAADGELVPQGTLAERIRAAAAGIGAFYTPTGVGTEMAEGKEHRVMNGKEYILEYPLHADYAFIRAYRSDTFGNLQYRLSQRNFNPIMAMAARTTIVEVEQDILDLGTMDPDQVHTPGICVDRVVHIPEDGIWEEAVYRD